MALVRRQLEAALGVPLPRPLSALLPDDGVLDRSALGFVAGPLLPLDGGAPRAFVANVAQADFEVSVRRALGDPAADFLAAGPPGGRRMVDLGPDETTLYLDDLHLLPDADPEVVARTLTLPARLPGELRRVLALPPPWVSRRQAAIDAGLDGLWLAHRIQGTIVSLLVVNEDRWRGTPEPAALRLDATGDPAWLAQRALAREAGLGAYPDAVEIRPEGRWVTVGLFDPRDPARRS